MLATKEANKEEVMVEEEVEDVDEVGVTRTTLKGEKPQHKVVEEATQDRGMTNPKFDAITVRSLDIMFQNVELPTTRAMRRPIMLKQRLKRNEHCH